MQPKLGPVCFRVTDADSEIAAGSSLGPIRFRFPRALFVTSVLLLPRSGVRADMAALRLSIEDETQQQIFSSGDGTTNETTALSLMGLRPINGPFVADLLIARPFALQRPVNTGDLWLVTIQNTGAAPITPELIFGFEDGES